MLYFSDLNELPQHEHAGSLATAMEEADRVRLDRFFLPHGFHEKNFPKNRRKHDAHPSSKRKNT